MAYNKILKKDLQDKHLQGKAILAFRATWCPPCRMIEGEILELAKEHPEINIFDFDVDLNIDFAREMGVQGIPSLFYFENGKQINASTGYMPASDILKHFK